MAKSKKTKKLKKKSAVKASKPLAKDKPVVGKKKQWIIYSPVVKAVKEFKEKTGLSDKAELEGIDSVNLPKIALDRKAADELEDSGEAGKNKQPVYQKSGQFFELLGGLTMVLILIEVIVIIAVIIFIFFLK